MENFVEQAKPKELIVKSRCIGGDPNAVVVLEGKNYRKIPTGYTEKQYYSHSTPEKGPGPGWDFHINYLEIRGLSQRDGLEKLSDEPLYSLDLIEK